MRSSLESSTKRATRNAKKSVDITDRCPIRHSPTVTTRWRYVKSYLSKTAAARFALWLFGNRHRLLALEGIHKGLAAEPQCCSYAPGSRSEEHTSELQSLMRISYAVFCLKKKTHKTHKHNKNYM